MRRLLKLRSNGELWLSIMLVDFWLMLHVVPHGPDFASHGRIVELLRHLRVVSRVDGPRCIRLASMIV